MLAVVLLLFCAACAKQARRSSPAVPASTTSTTAVEHEEPGSPETRPLDAARRAELGLPTAGQSPGTLAPLTEAQWARPELVAVRYVLVDTNYAATDDPASVAARRATYASERLRADLASSSSGAAGLEEQRRQGLAFKGEVLGLASVVDADKATVTITVRRTTTAAGVPTGAPRVGFHQLTLVRMPPSTHWLVVNVAVS